MFIDHAHSYSCSIIELLNTQKGLKVLQFNIRSLKNKQIIQEKSPHMLGCSECELVNSYHNDQLNSLKIPGYQLLLPKSWESHGYARVVVYIKKSLKFERMDVLEDDHLQTIWIKCGFVNSKKGYFCHGYREQKSNLGESIGSQSQKLSLFLDQWEQAINLGNPEEPNDIFILCDMNLDSYRDKWMDPRYRFYSLAQLVLNYCNANSVDQLVKTVKTA